MRTIHVFLPEAYADWELGYLLPAARGELGIEALTYSLTGAPVRSVGGLEVIPHAALTAARFGTGDVLVFCGSEWWRTANVGAFAEPVRRVRAADGTIAGICGGTLPLARLGLLDERLHTSNSLHFLAMGAPAYRGAGHYREATAIADGGVITAPGSAPVAFAAEVLLAARPEAKADIEMLRQAAAAEHRGEVSVRAA